MLEKNALYVYGIVKNGFNFKYNGIGLNGEQVYSLKEGDFAALVHDCEEKPYIQEEPDKIKELIIAHNNILNKAMKEFKGVIPLPFNTIIKKGENSAENNLKKWLDGNRDRLERIWNKIKGKKEYGIRTYYEQDKLIQEASSNAEVKEIQENMEGKSQGLSYLLKGKAKSKINEIAQNRINQFKQEFYDEINEIVDGAKINVSRVAISEKKDLLLGLSILVNESQIDKVKRLLEKTSNDFPFQLAGPFAPYSFVEK